MSRNPAAEPPLYGDTAPRTFQDTRLWRGFHETGGRGFELESVTISTGKAELSVAKVPGCDGVPPVVVPVG